MSQENVEIVQAAFEAWNAWDMDAVAELLVPDVVVRLPSDWPEPGPWVGRETVIRELKQQRRVYDGSAVEPVSDFLGVADRVVVRFINHGTLGGVDFTQEITGVYTLRGGKVFGWEHFYDHAEALEAVGLSEQDAHADS
jgi:ketosteroid isomerase-like protein